MRGGLVLTENLQFGLYEQKVYVSSTTSTAEPRYENFALVLLKNNYCSCVAWFYLPSGVF